MLCDTGILVAPNQNKVCCIVGCCIYTIWWRDGAETWAPLEQFELKEGREGKGRRGVECRVEWESLEWTYIWPCDWPANVCDPVGNFMEWTRQNVRQRADDACRSYGLEL